MMELDKLKSFIVETLEEKKADNVKVIELSDDVPLAKYLIFASGKSRKNVSSIAGYLADQLKHEAQRNVSIEGLKNSDWVLLDIGDIIVHVFHPEAREHFALENLYKNKR